MPGALSATPAVLTVELDPAAPARGQRPPEPLSRDAAEVLAGALADDLRRILGEEVAAAGLVMPGALYDLTELLRPGLPMIEALLDLYRGALRGGAFTPQLLALGTAGGRFPAPAIAPARRPGSGPLLALPFVLVAPGPALDPLRRRLEAILLEKGRASLATDRVLRQLLAVEPVHLSYATFHDLSALLKVQLEHAGFGGLWSLLEGALYRPEEPLRVDLPAGNRFLGLHGEVWTPITGFDAWAARHATAAGEAAAGYAAWCRHQRQYMAGLEAHGVPVIPTRDRSGLAAEDVEVAIGVARAAALPEPDWHSEAVTTASAGNAAIVSLTEQATPELGPLAYTVLVQADDGSLLELRHEYPLRPEAIPRIREHWQARAHALDARFHLERPGHVVTAGHPPRLMPWLEYAGEA